MLNCQFDKNTRMPRYLDDRIARLQCPRVHDLLDTSAVVQQSRGLGLVCKETPQIVLRGGIIGPENISVKIYKSKTIYKTYIS